MLWGIAISDIAWCLSGKHRQLNFQRDWDSAIPFLAKKTIQWGKS
jgi:hypothetical protein